MSTAPAAASLPITKILALGQLAAPLTAEQRSGILPREVQETVRVYLTGRIDQWYFRQDGTGVVFLLSVSSVDEAHALVEKLPFGQAKLMQFDFIPLSPLFPLRALLDDFDGSAIRS